MQQRKWIFSKVEREVSNIKNIDIDFEVKRKVLEFENKKSPSFIQQIFIEPDTYVRHILMLGICW